MSEQTALDEANINVAKAQEQFFKAQSIRQLVDGRFTPESAVSAIHSGDLSKLVGASA